MSWIISSGVGYVSWSVVCFCCWYAWVYAWVYVIRSVGSGAGGLVVFILAGTSDR